jgi:type I restriction enzyme M protein
MTVQQTTLFAPDAAGLAGDHKAILKEVRNYLAGSFVGATRDEALLHEVAKCLFIRIYMERHHLAAPKEEDGTALSRFYRQTFAQVKRENPALFDDDEELLLDPRSLAQVISALGRLPVVDAKRDAIGDAFEMFIGSHMRNQAGQFFTPKNAMQFLVEAVAPTQDERVIDPACGAGGFLATALQYLMTRGASQDELEEFASTRLFGIDKDSYLADLARKHIALLSGGRPNVVCADSLAWKPENSSSLEDIPAPGKYDVVITNPPFGSRIVSASAEVMERYRLSRKWKRDRATGRHEPTSSFHKNVPPQVLFIERCIGLLKPGGRLGIVVPESLVSSGRYQYVVDYMRREAVLEVVAGMPENLFKTSGKGGTHTKTALLVLHKRTETEKSGGTQIFMAEAKWCGHDSRGRTIPYDDIPTILGNLQETRNGGLKNQTRLGFLVSDDDIRDNLLAPRQYDPSVASELAELAETHQPVTVGELVEEGTLEISTGHEVGKLAYGTGTIPFVRTSDLSNWEVKIDAKHGISEDIYREYERKQDVQPGDVLMVRDGTYLIGTCAIITEDDLPLVYQSHVFKIRVRPNERGLNPHLLLALLSSPIVQRQVKAKRVTQDIIDSLGNRVLDLVLPLPKREQVCERITSMVQEVSDSRVRARRLALQVKDLVAAG